MPSGKNSDTCPRFGILEDDALRRIHTDLHTSVCNINYIFELNTAIFLDGCAKPEAYFLAL